LVYEEKLDSDDNIEGILRRMEEKCNFDHKSNVHVTGTLSLVTAKPGYDCKILNKNYYLEDIIKLKSTMMIKQEGASSSNGIDGMEPEKVFRLGSQGEVGVGNLNSNRGSII
jgi:hypothetical protein